MLTLKRSLPLTGVLAAMVAASPASAQLSLNDWILKLNPIGINDQYSNAGSGIATAGFTDIPSRVITNDIDGNGVPSVGDTQLAIGQGSVESLKNTSNVGSLVGDNGTAILGVNFELTFVFEIFESIDNQAGDNLEFSHTGGSFRIYADPNVNYGGVTGTGAADGTLVAEFAVVPGLGGGTLNSSITDGAIDVTLQATSITAGFLFLNDGVTDVSTLLDDNNEPLLISFTDSNFDVATGAVGDPSVPTTAGGIFNTGIAGGTAPPGDFANDGVFRPLDFFAIEDGSIRLGLLPEPGTMAIFGLGLLGLGLAVRRRQRATA